MLVCMNEVMNTDIVALNGFGNSPKWTCKFPFRNSGHSAWKENTRNKFYCRTASFFYFLIFFRNLSDLDKDGQLNIEEFVIAMHFVEVAKVGQALPPTVPQELLPLAYQSRQVSANNMPLVQEGRERSDSGLDRSGSERERSGSIDGKSRSGSITVCKSLIVSQELWQQRI